MENMSKFCQIIRVLCLTFRIWGVPLYGVQCCCKTHLDLVQNRDIWLTDAHIPGKLNTETDSLSRKCNDRTERMLNPDVFQRLSDILFRPGIDLFASRLNCQMKPLLSWSPDPHELAVDAFMVNWGKWLIYARPPFSVLQKVMMKWRRGHADPAVLAHSSLVSSDVEDAGPRACSPPQRETHPSAGPLTSDPSAAQDPTTSGMQLIREAIKIQGTQGKT